MALTTSLDENAPIAFGLVICAGLSTTVGACVVFCKRLVVLTSQKVLAAGIGVSAGCMLYVSFAEILVKSVLAFEEDGKAPHDAYLGGTVCFFSGVLVMKILGKIVHFLDREHSHDHPGTAAPSAFELDVDIPVPEASEGTPANVDVESPGDAATVHKEAEPVQAQKAKEEEHDRQNFNDPNVKSLKRMGVNTAAAIALHNFPEGLATFVATLADRSVGFALAVAIGIHNIPEGVCVAMPIYYATGSRTRAFLWAFLSGVSEPVGALVGYSIIKVSGDDMSQMIYGILFGLVAGMMVAIVLVELIPVGHRYDPEDKVMSNSVFAGMVAMAASLVLFAY